MMKRNSKKKTGEFFLFMFYYTVSTVCSVSEIRIQIRTNMKSVIRIRINIKSVFRIRNKLFWIHYTTVIPLFNPHGIPFIIQISEFHDVFVRNI